MNRAAIPSLPLSTASDFTKPFANHTCERETNISKRMDRIATQLNSDIAEPGDKARLYSPFNCYSFPLFIYKLLRTIPHTQTESEVLKTRTCVQTSVGCKKRAGKCDLDPSERQEKGMNACARTLILIVMMRA